MLRYGQSGTEFEWHFKLQGRIQKAEESFAEFVGSLRLLAYPGWTDVQITRNQFIQGVSSFTIQLHLMREIPESLEVALEEAGRLDKHSNVYDEGGELSHFQLQLSKTLKCHKRMHFYEDLHWTER